MSEYKKLFSVCIPTWNRAQMLNEQLLLFTNQILESKLENTIELVISNNGSEDETEKIVLSYQSRFNFIIYNNNRINKGARFNLLKSLELATGKFVTFLGDDDRYKSDSLRKIISFLEKNHTTNGLFDCHLFKNNPFSDNAVISSELLLQHFYYYIGNAGLFIIQTDLVQSNIKKYGYEFFSASWPQTQLIVLSLNVQKEGNIFLYDLDLFASSAHEQVMMYNSYYLLRGLYFDLADAIDDIKNEIPATLHTAARSYLKNTIAQTTFNILQCGVFVDDKLLRKKTVSYIVANLRKYSFKEKLLLYLIVFVLSLPVFVSRIMSTVFIFLLKGKQGLIKKNNFVKLELKKLNDKKDKNKAVRTFEF